MEIVESVRTGSTVTALLPVEVPALQSAEAVAMSYADAGCVSLRLCGRTALCGAGEVTTATVRWNVGLLPWTRLPWPNHGPIRVPVIEIDRVVQSRHIPEKVTLKVPMKVSSSMKVPWILYVSSQVPSIVVDASILGQAGPGSAISGAADVLSTDQPVTSMTPPVFVNVTSVKFQEMNPPIYEPLAPGRRNRPLHVGAPEQPHSGRVESQT